MDNARAIAAVVLAALLLTIGALVAIGSRPEATVALDRPTLRVTPAVERDVAPGPDENADPVESAGPDESAESDEHAEPSPIAGDVPDATILALATAGVWFEDESSDLSEGAFRTIDEVASLLVNHDEVHVTVVASDIEGAMLGQERAEVVLAALVERGIAENRLGSALSDSPESTVRFALEV